MGVTITYKGVDGKTTRLTAKSPKDAMEQLGGIEGYSGNIVDAAVIDLAKALATRLGRVK